MTTMVNVYTCQECGKQSLESSEFKMLSVLGIGFVICKKCIMEWGD